MIETGASALARDAGVARQSIFHGRDGQVPGQESWAGIAHMTGGKFGAHTWATDEQREALIEMAESLRLETT